MNYSIIIAEFNPLSNGHKYIIDKAKTLFPEDQIIIIMSGNFVQRGEPAIINKVDRANVAISLGASVVIELPTIYAISSAEDFAFGAIQIANNISGAKRIIFGSECGDIQKLYDTAEQINSPIIQEKIKHQLSLGTSYAASLRLAMNNNPILNSPNNLLGIEYIKALKTLNSSLDAVTIKREYDYNDKSISPFASSSALREKIYDKDLKSINGCLPDEMLDKFNDTQTPVLNRLYSMLFLKLTSTTPAELSHIDGISEGLEFRILDKLSACTSLDDFISSVSTKRYPESKIKRILLNILLGITKEIKQSAKIAQPIFSCIAIGKDKTILKDLAVSSGTLITKISDQEKLDQSQKEYFSINILADKIYSHITDTKLNSIYKHKL